MAHEPTDLGTTKVSKHHHNGVQAHVSLAALDTLDTSPGDRLRFHGVDGYVVIEVIQHGE